jgi:hypothetical protein
MGDGGCLESAIHRSHVTQVLCLCTSRRTSSFGRLDGRFLQLSLLQLSQAAEHLAGPLSLPPGSNGTASCRARPPGFVVGPHWRASSPCLGRMPLPPLPQTAGGNSLEAIFVRGQGHTTSPHLLTGMLTVWDVPANGEWERMGVTATLRAPEPAPSRTQSRALEARAPLLHERTHPRLLLAPFSPQSSSVPPACHHLMQST